ncbi:MAG: NADH dehydrogenase, partial [Bacteroidia bacterium]
MKESEYTQQKRILIVGAGFAGVALAKKLHRTNYDVVLLDRNNHHTFQPLLYQVATGGLEAGSIAYPVRRIIRGFKNVRFYMADVHNVNFESKVLATSVGELPYDILVMANGSTNNFFNFQPVKDQLLPLKSVADALDIRSYIMQNLEKAIATFDSNERSELLNIAIIGGGPAGLEMAGALAEMKIHTLPKDFPQIDFNGMRITLFEAGPKLLGAMSEAASKHSLKYLEKLGVDVKLGAKVSEYSNHRIVLEDGATFATDTVIWTAGVKGNALSGLPKEAIALGNRVHVDAFNAVIGMQDVYAIGDVAAMISDQNPRGHPMLAPVAIQQAKNLAR